MHYFAQNIWFSMSFYLLYELYWGEKDKDRSEKKKNLFLFLFFFLYWYLPYVWPN